MIKIYSDRYLQSNTYDTALLSAKLLSEAKPKISEEQFGIIMDVINKWRYKSDIVCNLVRACGSISADSMKRLYNFVLSVDDKRISRAFLDCLIDRDDEEMLSSFISFDYDCAYRLNELAFIVPEKLSKVLSDKFELRAIARLAAWSRNMFSHGIEPILDKYSHDSHMMENVMSYVFEHETGRHVMKFCEDVVKDTSNPLYIICLSKLCLEDEGYIDEIDFMNSEQVKKFCHYISSIHRSTKSEKNLDLVYIKVLKRNDVPEMTAISLMYALTKIENISKPDDILRLTTNYVNDANNKCKMTAIGLMVKLSPDPQAVIEKYLDEIEPGSEVIFLDSVRLALQSIPETPF